MHVNKQVVICASQRAFIYLFTSVIEPTADEVYDMLMKNFDRAYYGNTRAPLGLFSRAGWFVTDWHYKVSRVPP